MLSRRGAQIVFIVLVSLCLATAMSFAVTFVNAGFAPGFTVKWLRALVIAWAVAVPTAFLVMPAVRRLVDGLTARSR